MPRERSDMRRVKELLRLAHELGSSKRQIAVSIRMPKTTVNDYLARAEAAGLRYADVAGMSEEAVEARLYQRAELPEQRPCRTGSGSRPSLAGAV
jgi:DNA-binding transcriptional regulator LsrR (DeoR family)